MEESNVWRRRCGERVGGRGRAGGRAGGIGQMMSCCCSRCPCACALSHWRVLSVGWRVYSFRRFLLEVALAGGGWLRCWSRGLLVCVVLFI